jgi:predicted nucleotidyltransferase
MSVPSIVSTLTRQLRPLFQRPEVRLVILFGSHASGGVHRRSDLDLAILAQEPLDMVGVTAEIMTLLHLNNVDVVDLRRASPLLAREIVRQGVVLYEREPGTYAQFVSLTIRRYADTRKFREAQRLAVQQFLQEWGVR